MEVRANLLRKEDIDLLLLDESKGELLLVNGKTQDDRDLVLELGGRGVVGVDSQGLARLRPHLPDPCPAVTARIGDKVETDCSGDQAASSDIQGDIAMIQSKLEERLAEGRGLGSCLGRERREVEEEVVLPNNM